MSMYAKVHRKEDREGNVWYVTALCDKNLLGKVLKEGDVRLDLALYKSFYEGKPVSQDEAVQMLKDARNVNVVGEESVACAVKALKVDGENLKRVQGVPHVQIYYI